MPELIGSFFCLKVIALLCLTVFLGNYSVIKKIHVFNGELKTLSVICYGLGDYKSPGLIGRTFFYDGFQIRRDAWRGMGRLAGCGMSGGGMNDISGEAE